MWYQRSAARLTAWSRRRFFGAVLKLMPVAAATALPARLLAGKTADPASARGRATLERFCYLLFPYPAIGTAPYADIADALTASDAKTLRLLADGIGELDAARNRPWLDLSETEQLEVMQGIETGAFFGLVADTTKARLFNDTRLWRHIGYEGSSLEFGGYVGRGLNDIDWLDD